MDQPSDTAVRIAALDAASRIIESRHGGENDVFETAKRFYGWLVETPPAVRMTLTAGPASTQSPSSPKGNTMQLHDDEQFTLSVAETDAKGQPVTTDTLTWTVADPTVATLQVSADTYSAVVVAGNVGSTVVTLTDGTLTATEAVDVIAGTATAIVLNEGTAEPQPTAATGTGDGGTAGAPGSTGA